MLFHSHKWIMLPIHGTILAIAMLFAACAAAPSQKSTKANTKSENETHQIHIDDKSKSHFNDAAVAIKEKNYKHAEKILTSLTAQESTHPAIWVNLGVVLMNTNRPVEAETAWSTAISLSPPIETPYLLLARAQRQRGAFKEAEATLENASEKWPNNALIQYNLGILNELYLGNPAKAIAAYESFQKQQKSPDANVQNWIEQLKRGSGSKGDK